MLKNIEFSNSMKILVCLLLLFIGYQFFTMNLFYSELKRAYVHTLGETAVQLIERHPEDEAAIMSIVTKQGPTEHTLIQKGKSLFKQYGLTEDLDSALFPLLNVQIKKLNDLLFGGGITFCFILIIFNYIQSKNYFTKIRQFTSAANQVIEGDYTVTIDEHKEGDFSKLAVAFSSMRNVIRASMENSLKERKFLVQILQDISHQLKTPLSTISVYNELLLSKNLSIEQQRQFLMNNQVQISRMDILIQNMLKVAKIDAKAIEFKKEHASLNQTMNDVMDHMQSRLAEKYISFDFHSEKEVYLLHDRIWIQEALINIVKNAIEHSEEHGKIVMGLSSTPIYTEVYIQDFGVGIEQEDLPYIFERFYKVGKSNKQTSVGIGLALSKSIIEAHNGYIKVESQKNMSTTFTITFMKY